MRKSLAIAAVLGLALAGSADRASAQACGTSVGLDGDGTPFDLAADTVWGGGANPSPICLEEPVFVQPGVTLTILPGTLVRGQPRSAVAGGVDGTPGALIVTQGAKLVADGTANAPIIMTTAVVDNDGDGVCDDLNADGFFDSHPGFDPGSLPSLVPDATPTFCDADPTGAPMPPLASDGSANLAQWGGLVLLGRAPTNLASQFGAPGGHGFGFVEGLQLPGFDPADAQCAGVEPHDTSGVLRYVSVRHAGDEIGNGNELNGVTLCAVGDNTIIEFVEVANNFDDGFEWFGGTVNANHLMVAYAGDDQLDMDWGYTGSVQFAFTVMPFFDQEDGLSFGSRSGDKLGELDGDDYAADSPTVQSNVNVRVSYNATVFPGEANPAFAADTRDTTPWPLSGPYIANWTGIGSTPDGANPAVDPASTNLGVQMRHGFAGQVVNSAFVNTATPCLVIDTGSPESTTGHDLPDHAAADLTRWIATSCDGSAAMAASAADVADNGDAFATFDTGGLPGSCELNIRSTGGGFAGLVQEDPGFDPKAFGGTPYDPRPAGAGADCGVTPRLPGLDRAATYRGAFPPGVSLWTDGWTYLSQAGVL